MSSIFSFRHDTIVSVRELFVYQHVLLWAMRLDHWGQAFRRKRCTGLLKFKETRR